MSPSLEWINLAGFHARGVTCHPTSFGLACSAPRSTAEELFSESLDPGSELAVPGDIAELVAQITVSMDPERV